MDKPILLTLENVLQENDNSNKSDDISKKPIKLEQLEKLLEIFGDFVTILRVRPIDELNTLVHYFGPKIGTKMREFKGKIHPFSIGGFEMPTSEELIKLYEEFEKLVGDKEKEKYYVLESDDGDYTLADSEDNVYVYSGKTKKIEDYHQDIFTHISKHIMAKIVGTEFDY